MSTTQQQLATQPTAGGEYDANGYSDVLAHEFTATSLDDAAVTITDQLVLLG